MIYIGRERERERERALCTCLSKKLSSTKKKEKVKAIAYQLHSIGLLLDVLFGVATFSLKTEIVLSLTLSTKLK
jgi:hypothetical protein